MTPRSRPTHLRSRVRASSVAALVTLLAATMATTTGSPASATGAAAVTPTTTTTARAAVGTATPLAGLSVTDPNASQRLQVELSTTRGTLTIPSGAQANLTLAYRNHWSGDRSISFTGVETDVNAALASVQLVGNGTIGAATIGLTSFHEDSAVVYSAPNKHFYRYVNSPQISWTAAFDAARSDANIYRGKRGYLATMPSAELNDFVSSKIQGATNVWFGARAVANPAQGIERRWSWTGGPFLDTIITECSNGASTGAACTRINDAGRYSSWASGEPNNSGGNETVAVTNWNGSYGLWNDLQTSNTAASGYVIEYGDDRIGPGTTSFADVLSTSSTVTMTDKPSQPAAPTVLEGDGRLAAGLTAPNDNGSPVTEYVVTATPTSGGGSAVSQTCTAPTTSCVVTGLTNGQQYAVRYTATNAMGTSAASTAVNGTPGRTPGAPTAVTATPLDGSASVAFTAPTDTGGRNVTYRVTATPGGATATCSSSPCTVTGLANGTSHTFVVEAVNSFGTSTPSPASNAVTPNAPAGAVTGASVTRGNSSAEVSFTAPTSGGPVSAYSVTATPSGGGASFTVSCSSSPCTVPGLTNGTTYSFSVTSTGPGGSSSAVPAGTATPATTPDAPGNISALRGDESVGLTFTPPASNGGSTVTGYEYSIDGGTTWASLTTTGTTTLTGTISGLANGTSYTPRVRAVNAVGHSTAGIAGAATPARVPDAPSIAATNTGDGEVTVAFTTPAANGEPITGYTVTAQPGGASATCATSPCVVTGLTNGTAHTFTVVATNAVGDSLASPASAAVTPIAAPTAPRDLRVSSQDGSALLAFEPPVSDGGAPVTGYEHAADGGAWLPLTTTASQGRLLASVTGLVNGTTTSMRVRAVNAAGGGAASAAQQVTPAGPPTAPRDVVVAVTGPVATVAWQAPANDNGAPVTSYVVTAQPGGATCTAVAPSRTCQVGGLQAGRSYAFTVVAVNSVGSMAGTGLSPATASPESAVTEAPGAPSAVVGTPGDRVLVVRWTPPANPGMAPVSGYEVSIDGGRTWQAVTTTGSTTLTATVTGVRNGRTYPVMVRALNAEGAGTAAGTSTSIDEPHWYADPLTAIQRADLRPAPKRPATYRGPLRRTSAWATSSKGAAAMQLDELRGRQLQAGQAATLTDRKMFFYNTARLTQYGRDQLRSMVASLEYVDAVRCEGHVDYGGDARWAKTLSRARAATACEVLVNYGADVTTTTKAFGNTAPVVVGRGGHQARWANRRVVVVVTQG